MAEYRYTLALLSTPTDYILINRMKSPYQGLWNGVGGKIEANESPKQGIKREIQEETNISPTDYQLHFIGLMKWHISGNFVDGIYLFRADLVTSNQFEQPQMTREGLLAKWPHEWVQSPKNVGLVADLTAVIPFMHDKQPHNFYTNFNEANQLLDFNISAYQTSDEAD